MFEYARDIYLNMDSGHLVDWSNIRTRMAPFFYVAIFLIAWIVALGSIKRRAIRKAGLIAGKKAVRTVHQQFSLRPTDPAIFAQRFGVDQSQLEQWQNMAAVDIEVDEQTGIKTVTARRENSTL
jgi:hypothetical protein